LFTIGVAQLETLSCALSPELLQLNDWNHPHYKERWDKFWILLLVLGGVYREVTSVEASTIGVFRAH